MLLPFIMIKWKDGNGKINHHLLSNDTKKTQMIGWILYPLIQKIWIGQKSERFNINIEEMLLFYLRSVRSTSKWKGFVIHYEKEVVLLMKNQRRSILLDAKQNFEELNSKLKQLAFLSSEIDLTKICWLCLQKKESSKIKEVKNYYNGLSADFVSEVLREIKIQNWKQFITAKFKARWISDGASHLRYFLATTVCSYLVFILWSNHERKKEWIPLTHSEIQSDSRLLERYNRANHSRKRLELINTILTAPDKVNKIPQFSVSTIKIKLEEQTNANCRLEIIADSPEENASKLIKTLRNLEELEKVISIKSKNDLTNNSKIYEVEYVYN